MYFWSKNTYRGLYSVAIFLIIIGGVLSVLDFLTENSQSIFLSGLIILLLLILFKNKFRS